MTRAKEINVIDVINVLTWDREVEIQDRLHTVIFTGIANNVPKELYGYELNEIDNRFNCIILKVAATIK